MPNLPCQCSYRIVALLAEGVDRNTIYTSNRSREDGSPSSRRAWIEIVNVPQPVAYRRVALLAEGVDRNTASACTRRSRTVALLAEGVDRNISDSYACRKGKGRPPRGGRG